MCDEDDPADPPEKVIQHYALHMTESQLMEACWQWLNDPEVTGDTAVSDLARTLQKKAITPPGQKFEP
jgi:hypothetical protein